jgi:hypothetical protein
MSRTQRAPEAQTTPSEQSFLSQERSLVPPAERPNYASPHDFEETSTETIWENPFDYDVAVQVHVGATPRPDPTERGLAAWRALPEAKRREMMTGKRTYVIKANSRRAIPSDFDQAIQQTRCTHPECPGQKSILCRDGDHAEHRLIVGGLYPRLINRGTQQRPLSKPAELHWSLDDQRARSEEALANAKAKLMEAGLARDALLVAQAEMMKAQEIVAETEARMAAKGVEAEGARANAAVIAESVGKPAGGKPSK